PQCRRHQEWQQQRPKQQGGGEGREAGNQCHVHQQRQGGVGVLPRAEQQRGKAHAVQENRRVPGQDGRRVPGQRRGRPPPAGGRGEGGGGHHGEGTYTRRVEAAVMVVVVIVGRPPDAGRTE